MLPRLLSYLTRATSLQPRYTPNHCLAVTKTVGGCSKCADVCPHDAVTVTHRGVNIDDVDCTGCGLCVQACPSQALESRVDYQPGSPLKCSQVKGSAQTVHCLARLEPSDLLRLAGKANEVKLARGDCADCPIGSAAVPDALSELAREAERLAAFRGRSLSLDIAWSDELNITDDPKPVSRRELLHGGWRGFSSHAADALAPLERFAEPAEGDTPLPLEHQKRYWLIESAAPEGDTKVPWTLPRIADGCIMCPVCTNVCPTDAFHRTFDDDGGGTLKLEPDRCNGCNACVVSCPVRVISLDDEVTWSELSGGSQEVYRKTQDKRSVPRS